MSPASDCPVVMQENTLKHLVAKGVQDQQLILNQFRKKNVYINRVIEWFIAQINQIEQNVNNWCIWEGA